jgi:hypothetical protein
MDARWMILTRACFAAWTPERGEKFRWYNLNRRPTGREMPFSAGRPGPDFLIILYGK